MSFCCFTHLLSLFLFRSSSALCEFVSRWAQTPAPHFLPAAWAHSGVAGIHCTLCMSNTLIFINIRTPHAQGQADLCVCWFILSGLSERWQNVSPSRQHLTEELKINMWPRRVLCILTAFICIYYSGCWHGSHPGQAEYCETQNGEWIQLIKTPLIQPIHMAVKANQLVLGL